MSAPLRPNAEQQAIIEAAARGETLVVNALAGTGKTTTLAMLAAAHPASRILYLAFNRPIANEAQAKMPRGVRAKTFHALAFGQMRPDTERLNQRLNGRYVADRYRVESLCFGREVISANEMASLALATLSRFCASTDARIAPDHVPDLLTAVGNASETFAPDGPGEATMREAAVEIARLLWAEQCDPNSRCPITHDSYIKRWALDNPRIDADLILFDEAQDASPLFIDIVERQRAQVVWVGDHHQQIYAWRGAENALARVQHDRTLYLTGSYRFPDAIARNANLILERLGEPHTLKGYGSGEPQDGSAAILTRTNVEAIGQFLAAREDKHARVRLIGASDMLALLRHLQNLISGRPSGPFALFSNYNDLRDHSRTAEGKDLSVLVKAVEDHGLPRLKQELTAASRLSPDEATLTLSTVHRAKGQEWDRVRIVDDWPALDPGEPDCLSPEEQRLLYVALTRARVEVRADPGIKAWIASVIRDQQADPPDPGTEADAGAGEASADPSGSDAPRQATDAPANGELQTTVKALRDQLADSRREAERLSESLRDQIDQFQREAEAMVSAYERLRGDHETLKAELRDCQTRLERLERGDLDNPPDSQPTRPIRSIQPGG